MVGWSWFWSGSIIQWYGKQHLCIGLKIEQFRRHEPGDHFVATAAFIGLGLVVLILLGTLHRRTRELSLANGDVIWITPAPFLTSLLSETSCKIIYQPKHGNTETLVLLQDSDSQPAMVIPATDGKTFLCLYYADVLYRLMKVYPGRSPTPFAKTSYLNFVVLSSSCHLESGTTNDWHEVSEYLKSVPPNTFNQHALGFRRKVLTSGVDLQIWNMRQGFTN